VNLSNEERETHFNMVASDRSLWEISTDDPVMQRKLERVGATFVREDFSGTTRFYTLPAKQVRLVRERIMSDEQRTVLSERMRAMRADQDATRDETPNQGIVEVAP
jgi:hypothetical protein